MDNKEYVVIYTDIGDTCDGLARVLTTTVTLQEAQAEMTKDVNNYLLKNPNTKLESDERTHRIVVDSNGDDACIWQILSLKT